MKIEGWQTFCELDEETKGGVVICSNVRKRGAKSSGKYT